MSPCFKKPSPSKHYEDDSYDSVIDQDVMDEMLLSPSDDKLQHELNRRSSYNVEPEYKEMHDQLQTVISNKFRRNTSYEKKNKSFA
jgi:hypothetical protein